MLNENVKKLLKENMWDLATCSAGVPNAVPVAFKDVTCLLYTSPSPRDRG